MDLTIFITFLIVAFILFIVADQIDVSIYVIAWMVTFILGMVVLTGNLEYQRGTTINQSFSYLDSDNSSIGNIVETHTPTMVSFSDDNQHLLGWGMAVISVAGATITFTRFRRGVGDDDED